METLTKTLSIDDNRIAVIEKVVLSRYAICFKAIKDIRFPKYASISAIYRNYQIIIPSGAVVIQPKDTLLMVTAPENSKNLLKYVEAERTEPIKPAKVEKKPAKEAVEAPAPSAKEPEAPAKPAKKTTKKKD